MSLVSVGGISLIRVLPMITLLKTSFNHMQSGYLGCIQGGETVYFSMEDVRQPERQLPSSSYNHNIH